MANIKQGCLAHNVAYQLAERIISGELKDGAPIREIAVTQALNVSRGTVREALLILQRHHLVDIIPNRGAQVQVLSADHIRSLYAVVNTLYTMLGRLLCERWTQEAQLLPFVQVRRKIEACLRNNDIRSFVEQKVAIIQSAEPIVQNPYLSQALASYMPAISRTYYLAIEQRMDEMLQFTKNYDQMLKAIHSRDADSMVQAINDYCTRNCNVILSVIGEAQPCA